MGEFCNRRHDNFLVHVTDAREDKFGTGRYLDDIIAIQRCDHTVSRSGNDSDSHHRKAVLSGCHHAAYLDGCLRRKHHTRYGQQESCQNQF